MKKKTVSAFFGAGSIAEKTILAGYPKPKYIFDNNLDLLNTEQDGVPILPPKEITSRIDKIDEIIITTSSFTDVKKQLIRMKIDKKKIKISKILDSLRFVEKLENHTGNYLFTSGLPSFTNDNSGGGVYLLEIKKNNYRLKKIHSGNCHGAIYDFNKKEYFITDNDLGIIVLNENLEKKRIIETEKGLRPHGITLINDDIIAVGCTFDDSVILIDRNKGNQISRLGISERKIKLNSPQHHLNDIWSANGEIYASMFSVSGQWKQGIFDGTVVSFGKDFLRSSVGKFNKILTDLRMPHNYQKHHNEELVCNSLEGQIINSNKDVLFQSNGFVRGLYVTKENFIVGESRNRNFANIKSDVINSSIDTRISIIDRESGAFRYIQFPLEISEIHSVISINN